ncbi:molybdate transporter, molybdate-binding protein [Rhodococcus jostii RHA1]|uniref:Molybdate transporter, molybdate-binding protein n=1 Tax=Rhodococcus jostii (strain RHA1) TaxID=101510 RepID=Q0SAJ5_RHOJR|nr:molybdate ABC transporter substrate-binding protein [Rhodococcus jostii]ABG95441.1 molybdate transporter, molybdate-binding protein [Rhodococcus jostii RHA1]
MRMSWRRATTGAAAAALGLGLLTGCGSNDDSGASGPAEPASASAPVGDITVFAAASLKGTFTELGQMYETANPGSHVEFSFAGSSDLAAQLDQGASADVFASADTDNMTKVVDAGLVEGSPVDFATNTLTIVTAPGNPKGITSFADLNREGTLVVTCAPQVPCGSATQKVETASGVDLNPVSEESSVTDVLNKVTAGQADAGLVYVTDAASAGDKVTAVAFPEAAQAVNTYRIATLSASKTPDAAQGFVDLVTGPDGQAVLARAGFAQP